LAEQVLRLEAQIYAGACDAVAGRRGAGGASATFSPCAEGAGLDAGKVVRDS
jgi:hypothetical protein